MGCNCRGTRWDTCTVATGWCEHVCMEPCFFLLILFWTVCRCDREVCAWRSSCWVARTKLRVVSKCCYSVEEIFILQTFARYMFRERRTSTGSCLLAGRSTSPSSLSPSKNRKSLSFKTVAHRGAIATKRQKWTFVSTLL